MSWRGAGRNSTATTPPQNATGETRPMSAKTSGVAHPVDAYSSTPTPMHHASPPTPVMAGTRNFPLPAPTQNTQTSTTDHPVSPYACLPPPPPNPDPRQSYVSSATPNTPYQGPLPTQLQAPSGMYPGYAYQAGPYAPTADQQGGKIVGGSRTGVSIRYGLMAAHFILLVLTTVLSAVFLRDLIMLIIHCCLALAFLIYVPAALGVTVARQKSHFDHAGGEVAYLVIQMVGWLASGILNAIYLTYLDLSCDVRRRRIVNGRTVWYSVYSSICRWSTAIMGLSFAHFALLLGWMTWVVVVVYRASPGNPDRAFQISTGWLLRGWKA